MSKKELVLRAIRGETVERIPVGFWLHYVTQEEKELGLDNPAVVEKSIKGHQHYVEEISQAIRETFTEEIASFYNIFSPISYLKRWFRTDQSRGDQMIADFIKEDPETLAHVLDVIAGDIATLSRRLIQEAGVEGIYFSTQQVLEADNEAGGINILHICGFEGASNEVELFKDYPAQVINWATHHEGLSLAAGRKLFGDRAVLGGFVNGKKGLLYQGEREAIEQETRRLVAEAGSRGLILGADCTVPDDFQLERLDWVRQAAVL